MMFFKILWLGTCFGNIVLARRLRSRIFRKCGILKCYLILNTVFKQDHRDKLELMKAAYIEQGNLRTLKERLSFEVASKSFSPDYSGFIAANGSVDIEALSMLDIFDGQLPDDMYDAFSHSHVPCGSIAVSQLQEYVDARLLKLKNLIAWLNNYNRVFDKVIDPMYRWECDESGLGHGGYIEFRNAQLTQLATEFLKAIEVTPPYEHLQQRFYASFVPMKTWFSKVTLDSAHKLFGADAPEHFGRTPFLIQALTDLGYSTPSKLLDGECRLIQDDDKWTPYSEKFQDYRRTLLERHPH